MKNLILVSIGGILGLLSRISLIWTLIEFILYVAKDNDPFNWWSVFVPIILIVVATVLGTIALYGAEQIKSKRYGKF